MKTGGSDRLVEKEVNNKRGVNNETTEPNGY